MSRRVIRSRRGRIAKPAPEWRWIGSRNTLYDIDTSLNSWSLVSGQQVKDMEGDVTIYRIVGDIRVISKAQDTRAMDVGFLIQTNPVDNAMASIAASLADPLGTDEDDGMKRLIMFGGLLQFSGVQGATAGVGDGGYTNHIDTRVRRKLMDGQELILVLTASAASPNRVQASFRIRTLLRTS